MACPLSIPHYPPPLPVCYFSVSVLFSLLSFAPFTSPIPSRFSLSIFPGPPFHVKHVDDGLVYYKQVVAELCSECQVFDSWFLHLQDQMAKNGGCCFFEGAVRVETLAVHPGGSCVVLNTVRTVVCTVAVVLTCLETKARK